MRPGPPCSSAGATLHLCVGSGRMHATKRIIGTHGPSNPRPAKAIRQILAWTNEPTDEHGKAHACPPCSACTTNAGDAHLQLTLHTCAGPAVCAAV